MSKKRIVLRIIAASVFAIALSLLIVAMTLHAILGDDNSIPAVFAILALASAFAAIVTALISAKGE